METDNLKFLENISVALGPKNTTHFIILGITWTFLQNIKRSFLSTFWCPSCGTISEKNNEQNYVNFGPKKHQVTHFGYFFTNP